MKPGDLVIHKEDKRRDIPVPGLVLRVGDDDQAHPFVRTWRVGHALVQWPGIAMSGWHPIGHLEIISEAGRSD